LQTPATCRANLPGRLLLPDSAVDEFADDVEVTDVTRVLLQQVQQDALKCGRRSAVPALPRLPNLVQGVRLDDNAAAISLVLQLADEVGQGLLGGDVPAAPAPIAPGSPT